MPQILFEWFEFVSNASNLLEWLEFAFECFESPSNISNLRSNARMVWICFECFESHWSEWFEFAFESFKSHSNGSIFHSNLSNPVWMVQISLQMVWIPFKWFKFVFECFESHSNSWNLHSNAWNPLRMTQICIPMLWIPCEWFKFACKSFKSHSNGSNFYSNVLNHVQMFQMNRMQILTIRLGFEAFECKFQLFERDLKHSNMIRNIWFECFESLSNGSNLHSEFRLSGSKLASNPSNPIRVIRIWIWILQIPFEWFVFAFECFESHSNSWNLLAF